tara:strand:+ start:7375 stop:7794 length:420 start_codon:yes stop_codon:yes gene_type:complete
MGIKGKLTIELIRNKKVVETQTVDNIIVTTGKGLVAQLVSGVGTSFTHMAIGSTATAEAIGDATLGGEVGRVLLTGKTVASNVISFVGDFPAGTGTGTIVEGGIFNASSGGVMLNRATFSAVSKTASDALKITWDVTFG